MKRLSRVLKNRTFPVLTLVALIAVGVGYYLFYVRNRESYFNHRYLRLLAFESDRIEERLSTFESIFANREKDPTLKKVKAKDLGSLAGMERLDLVPPDFQIAPKGITRDVRIEGDRVWLYAGWKQGEAEAAQDVVYRFDPFSSEPPEELETIFVASRDGMVLYEKSQPGRRELRIVDVKKILTPDGKEFDLAAVGGSTSRLDVFFAGQPYKLFLRPCCRAIWRPSPAKPQDVQRIQLDVRIGPSGTTVAQAATTPEPTVKPSTVSRPSLEWMVGGMVRSSTLYTRAWAISFTWGIVLFSLFILALLSLPFLRVLAIGPEEKLRVADALWIGFTAIVGVGLLTLLLLDLHAYGSLVDRMDARLQRLATSVEHQMKRELEDAWDQLKDFNQDMEASLAHFHPESCEDLWKLGVKERDRAELSLVGYPDFERFVWMDSMGHQCFKRALSFPSDPLVQVQNDRRYWREAQNEREAIEPVFSTATGSRVAVLAKPILGRPFVGLLGVEMNSLNRPVLPPGFGFAVIEDDGDVLFHSEPGRAGYENFFEETDNDRGLRALVYARRGGEVNAPYLGRGHRLRVEPISLPGSTPPSSLNEPPFWTLVTFSDKREMRALNVDLLTTALLFLILYLLSYMIGCGLIRAGKRRYRAGWLWPERKDEPRSRIHLVLSVFYGLCLLVSGAAIALLDGLDLLLFALMFPWAVLVVSYRLSIPKMKPLLQILLAVMLVVILGLILWTPGSGVPPKLADQEEWRKVVLILVGVTLAGFYVRGPVALRIPVSAEPGWTPPRWVYLVAASLLLTLTAVMPATAFFCIAHRAHLETRIKRAQLELALRSEQRDARLEESFLEKSLAKKRRGKSWDMYHRFFFATDRSLPASSQQDKTPAQLALELLVPERSRSGDQAKMGAQDPFCLLPAFLQKVLPLYTEDFIRVRRLLDDSDRDGRGPWRWQHSVGGQIEIQGAPLRFSSTVPPVSLQGQRLLLPLSLLLLGGTIFGVTFFVARRLLLYGIATPEPVTPISVAQDLTQNFLFVASDLAPLEKYFRESGAAMIDLSGIESRDDLLQHFQDTSLVRSQRICLLNFQHLLQVGEHNLLKLELLEELILGRDKPVTLLSNVVPMWHLLDRKPLPSFQDDTDPQKVAQRKENEDKARVEIQERWRRLLRRFVVWDSSAQVNASQLDTDLAAIQSTQLQTKRGQRLLDMAREECSERDQLQVLAKGLVEVHLQDLSKEMFLEDLREKAEPYYRSLWSVCTDKEKVVLVHLAEGGLVNARNIRPLRMLMRRGLVKRAPHFRVMNESFRHFVARDVCLNEVRDLERKAEASAWGRIRGPLALGLLGVAAFFFITQREIFDISMAFLSTIAVSLPTVFRVFGMVTPGQAKPAA